MFDIIIDLFVWIFTTVCWWKVFSKASIAGWKAIIPFYNDFLRYKMAGKPNLYWAYLLVSVVKQGLSWISVFVLSANLIELIVSGNVNETGVEMKVIGWILTVVLFLLEIYIGKHIANKFGKSDWFGVGIGALPIVFVAILAFSDAEFDDKEWI